ncbi:MAG: rhodanese-related sulfurtransferase [Alphaproteobacteria bacterium]|nr:rhodanese-related sulfurtransferase [Alphaproteobacteria bacterium]
MTGENWTIAALYRFVHIADTRAEKAILQPFCDARGICGTLLLAPEGINGTMAGPTKESMEELAALLNERFGMPRDEIKWAEADHKPFNRMKVRLKKEIITMRQPQIDPVNQVGDYVDPQDWNALISQDDVIVLDTRNDYETKLGIFKGAIDPQTKIFTEFAGYVEENLDPAKHKKVAMYCTGGIRCEKASSYMLSKGFEKVYHLKGGILKYLETVSPEESLWDGACFVFDHRVGVEHGLAETDHSVCFGCREPLTAAEQESDQYIEGICCPHCADRLTPERQKSLTDRNRSLKEQKLKQQKKAS